MKEQATSCIVVTGSSLLALALFCRADEPPSASSDGFFGSQEVMSRIVGVDSYPILEGYNSNALIQVTTIDRIEKRNTKALQTCTGILISEREGNPPHHAQAYGIFDPEPTRQELMLQLIHNEVPDTYMSKYMAVGKPDELDDSLFRHDYCVLRLQRSISPSEAVTTPLAAKTMTDVPYGTHGVIFGWGRQSMDPGGLVTQLKGINVITTECHFPGTSWQEREWPPSILPEDKARSIFICALRPVGKGGTCPGDSGGPLIIDGSIRGISLALLRENFAMYCTDNQLNMDIWLDIAAPPIADDLRNRLAWAPTEG